MEMVTRYAGEKHISAEDWAELNRGLTGAESYALPIGRKFETELVSNNLLKIYDGCGVMQGRQVRIPAGQSEEITIENGTQGEKRIDLVVERYTKNEDTKVESSETILIKGTPSETDPQAPACTEGDIRAGDTMADWPLYEVELDGINVVAVRPVFKMLLNMSTINDSLSELIGKLQNIDYEIIESEYYYVKKYENGWFEAWAKTTVEGEGLTFIQIGTSGIYYARVTNIGIGITVTNAYDIEFTPRNTGIVWGASPAMNANMQAIDGYIVQYGADKSRVTNIRAHVTGKWK